MQACRKDTVFLHQHTEKIILGHVDSEDDSAACRLRADLLPIRMRGITISFQD